MARHNPTFGHLVVKDPASGAVIEQDATWGTLKQWMLASARHSGDLRQIVLKQLAAGDEPSRDDLAAALRQSPPVVSRVKILFHQRSRKAHIAGLMKFGSLAVRPAESGVEILPPMTRAQAADYLKTHAVPCVSDDAYRAAVDQAVAEAQAAIDADTRTLLDYAITRYVLETQPRRVGRRRATERDPATERAIVLAYFAALKRRTDARDADARAPRDVSARAYQDVKRDYPSLTKRSLQRIISGFRLR